MLDFNKIVISSNNKHEMLYLLSILNSCLSKFLFNAYLKTENEQAILLGIKSIKQYIRVPKITTENQFIKDEVIKTTEQMLDLEKVTLRDVVNFNGVQMQQFNSLSVVGNNLVLDSMRLNIPENYIVSVRDALQNKYFDKKAIVLTTKGTGESERFKDLLDKYGTLNSKLVIAPELANLIDVIPITSPFEFASGPPLFPSFIAVSV